MKKKLTGFAIFLVGSLLFVPAVMADSYCPVPGTSLTDPGTYGGSGFSCFLNATGNPLAPAILDFSQFSWSPNPTNAPVPTVNAIPPNPAPAGGSGDLGFNFTAAWNSANTTDAHIGFDVTGVNGTTLDDVFIFFDNTGPFFGNGEVVYTENVTNTTAGAGFGQHFSISVYDPASSATLDELLSSHFTGPVTSIQITKDVQFACANTPGGPPATCTSDAGGFMSGFGNLYSYNAVPEPRGISLLLGLLLMGGLLVYRRRQAVQSQN